MRPEPEDLSGAPGGGGYPDSEAIDISRWWAVLRRRWLLVAATLGICVAVAAVNHVITPRQYRAMTVLQVERNNLSIVADTEIFGRSQDWWSSQSFYPTQERLLKSRGLGERVVKNLRLVEDPTFNPDRSMLAAHQGPGSEGVRPPSAEEDAAVLARMAQRLVGGLDVRVIPDTRLIEVSYRAPTGELAARVVNGVADAYIEWGFSTRKETVGKASSALASQIISLKEEIAEKEAQLQSYSLRTDIVNLDPASNDTMQRLEVLNEEYAKALSERISKDATARQLAESKDDAIVDTLSGGLVAQLRLDLLRLEREYATNLSTFKPEWPAMRQLRAQIDKGREDLDRVAAEVLARGRDVAAAESKAASRKEQNLKAELDRQKAAALELNSASVEYNNLKVEVSTRRALLEQLMQKRSRAGVAEDMEDEKQSNVTIVDRALVPGAPYTPNLRRGLGMGLFVGLFLGVVLAFAIEILDRRIKTPEDVERVLRLPLLAVIGDSSRASGGYGGRAMSAAERSGAVELLPFYQPRLAVSEAYRTLRTALLLSSASGVRHIAVTSGIPGEGKTATAVNLAVVLSQLGRRVLLIDGDLRRPRLHQVFGVPNRAGLVNLLTGVGVPAEPYLATVVPGLSFLPAGPVAPNPSELIASDRMRALVESARELFDHIVFDTPPVGPVTDATLVGDMVDGVILCVGARIVRREEASTARERLDAAGVKVLGVVLNRFQSEQGRGHFYGYGSYGQRDEVMEDAPSKPVGKSGAPVAS